MPSVFFKTVSVIVPLAHVTDYLYECLDNLRRLDWKDLEVIVLPDNDFTLDDYSFVKIQATGKVGPAIKRDMGAKIAKNEILAFLDDDAYPTKNWLIEAVKHFENKNIAAIGGPAITPNSDPFWAKVSGAFFVSPLGGGNPYRYYPGPKIEEIDDWPSVNLLVRKEDFLEAGGFNTKYWPGEDTKLCWNLVYKQNKKMIYDPNVVVWHHRRSSIVKHLKQVGQYGLHRGHFVKLYPETSKKITFFMPSFFLMGLICALVISPFVCGPLLLLFAGYGFAMFVSAVIIWHREGSLIIGAASIPYAFLSHVIYGWNFFKGYVLVKKLESKLADQATAAHNEP